LRVKPDFVILIPARFASTRYPGKPLTLLRGCNGEPRSLIERSWRSAIEAASPEQVWVATDDRRIADAVRCFGGQVVMTPESCRNGTERCAAALEALGDVAPVVVNFQGDAPLTPALVVSKLVECLAADSQAAMTTPAVACSPSIYGLLVADQAAGRVGGTTVVGDAADRALYFSKQVIPHLPTGTADAHRSVRLHLGVYAYRPAALARYAALAPTTLELSEGLEQLRFLENGLPIRLVPFAPLEWDCIELNNPEDVPAIEAILHARGIR
jgi:3-deoxy-manno-octulosonate cytidylyltransferase (CMP-KDO synthetase)